MKKIFRYVALLGLGTRALAAAAAPVAAPKEAPPTLAALVTLEPFAEFQDDVTRFGQALGNPFVSSLILTLLQQNIVSTYGQFRADKPMYFFSYQTAAGKTDDVFVFPSVDRIARMALNNPGSERLGSDALHLMPTERHPSERYAVFSESGDLVAFATSVAQARRALQARPAAEESLPVARVKLYPAGIRAVAAAGRRTGATNVVDTVRLFTRLDLALDMSEKEGLVLAFAGTRAAPAGDDAQIKARLTRALECLCAHLLGEGAAVKPALAVTVRPKGEVEGRVALSEKQIRAFGNLFNAFVTQQMMGKGGRKPAATSKEK